MTDAPKPPADSPAPNEPTEPKPEEPNISAHPVKSGRISATSKSEPVVELPPDAHTDDDVKDSPVRPKPALVTEKPRSWIRHPIWIALALVVLATLVLLSRLGSAVRFEQGLSLVAVTSGKGFAPGGVVAATLHFEAQGPLTTNQYVFAHLESTGPGVVDPKCRVVGDKPTETPATGWTAGQKINHSIELRIPQGCRAAHMTLLVGLYDPSSGKRLNVLSPSTFDRRIDIVHLETSGDPAPELRSGRSVVLGVYLELLRPFAKWLALAFAATLTALYFGSRKSEPSAGQDKQTSPANWLRYAVYLAPATLLIMGVLVSLEFIKDDAYISFRYAHNFVHGDGLVFNRGDRLEGFTNFLWTMLMVPFEALGWDLFQVCEWLGTGFGLLLIWQMGRIHIGTRGGITPKHLGHVWGGLWLSASSSFVLWSKSGLEQPLATYLPVAGASLLWGFPLGLFGPTETSETETERARRKRLLIAGVVMGLGCTTRPELHLIAVLVGIPLVIDLFTKKVKFSDAIFYAYGVLLITVPFHAFRILYFKSLMPNTYYVKTSSNSLVWRAGLGSLRDMFSFNDTGALVVFAPLAFASRSRWKEKLTMSVICLAFMAYIIKVGVDEMQWHRLYLPALPFLCIMAGLGLEQLVERVTGFLERRKIGLTLVPTLGAWVLVGYAASQSFSFTYKEMHGFDGHGDLAGTYHPDIGKFVTRHERPGALAAFQDMGSTPYHAPDIDWLDFIGLVDGTIARARHSYGLHAFVGVGDDEAQRKYDADMREYYWKRNPEWAVLTVYPPQESEAAIAAAFDRDPGPEAIGGAYHNNSYQFGIWADPRFHKNYVHVRTWQRSRGYYLSLFRRRDLWDQTPREVVLETPPANLPGPKVEFEKGLSLLGATVDPEAKERHEIYITTWWNLPGAMPEDTTFFVHINREGYQAPFDHVPGDWMYPANRWVKGQTLEDRVLFQLPLNMKPGTYTVNIGVYRKSNGERLKVLSGPSDGTGRISVGTFTVKPLYPIIHQLIPPGNPEKHRKYPDRIIDSKRLPSGT